MTQFENLIANSISSRKTHEKFALIIEALAIAFVWILLSRIAYIGIMRPILLEHPSRFVWELNFAIFVILFSFLAPLCILFLWRGMIGKLQPLSLINRFDNFRIINFIIGMSLTIIIMAALTPLLEVNVLNKIIARFSAFGIGASLILLFIYLIAFGIQTAFEEILFRGSLVQNLTAMGLHFIIAIFFSAFVFALLHMNQNMPQTIFFSVFLMALAYSYSTFRTGGVEISMGAHLANNFIIGAIFGNLDNAENAANALVSSIAYIVLYVAMLETVIRFRPETRH